MRNRDYKKWGSGEIYHLYNRGNGKQNIFIDNEDYKFFLLRLRQNLFPKEEYRFRTAPLPENSFSLISYCLMPNHFHFILKQNREIPATKLLSRICTSYSINFNKKYQRTGQLFQSKFRQVTISSNRQLLWLSAYIHQNPKVAGLTKKLGDYPWSSFFDITRENQGSLCEVDIILNQFKNNEDYINFVDSSFEIIKDKKDLEYLLLDD